jgi:hypothetical protein
MLNAKKVFRHDSATGKLIFPSSPVIRSAVASSLTVPLPLSRVV